MAVVMVCLSAAFELQIERMWHACILSLHHCVPCVWNKKNHSELNLRIAV